MTISPTPRRLVATVATVTLAGGLLGASAGTALAAAKPKPKPKAATHTTAKAVAHVATGVVVTDNVRTHRLDVRVGKAVEAFTTTAATTVTDAGKKVSLTAVKAKDAVRVTYTTAGKAGRHATSVVITKA